MSQHTHVTFKCDRCRCAIGDTLLDHDPLPTVKASFAYKTSTVVTADWTDLCDKCYVSVCAFFLPSAEQPPLSELRAAREFFKELLAVEPGNHRQMRVDLWLHQAALILKGDLDV